MDRLLLTLGTLVFAIGCYALMLRGWRSRTARQAGLPAPAAPSGLPLTVGPFPALYVGTTGADDWLDRITVHHLADRGTADVGLSAEGLVVERPGLPALLIPARSTAAATIETALAGKVVSTGMLVVTWLLGDRRLATGLVVREPADRQVLLDALTAALPAEPTPLEATG